MRDDGLFHGVVLLVAFLFAAFFGGLAWLVESVWGWIRD